MKKQKAQSPVDSLEERIAELENQIAMLIERERRAQADYANVLRRAKEERSNLVKFATIDIVSDLLESFEHLSLAAEQLQDAGLTMIVSRLWQTLNSHGLEEIEVLGKPFDPTTMEAVAPADEANKDAVVTKVMRRGYSLNGKVIQFAKVSI